MASLKNTVRKLAEEYGYAELLEEIMNIVHRGAVGGYDLHQAIGAAVDEAYDFEDESEAN